MDVSDYQVTNDCQLIKSACDWTKLSDPDQFYVAKYDKILLLALLLLELLFPIRLN
jgi:hypothetical protein